MTVRVRWRTPCAPANPPSPPFETDESKKFWKTLVKTEGHGKFLYEKSLEWQKKQRSKKGVNAAATSASGQARVTFEKGKDYGNLFNLVGDSSILANMSKTD